MAQDLLDTASVERALAAAGVSPPGRLLVLEQVGSTSTELRSRAVGADPWPDGSVLLADDQVGGRGRAGRTWTTPPGRALTFSVLLRPQVPVERLGWAPLLAGLSVVEGLRSLGLDPVLKWPNDVLLPAGTSLPGWGPYRKVAGVLAELVAQPAPAVVLGIGINVHQESAELPVASATSVALAGAPASRARVLAAVLDRWWERTAQWRREDGRVTGRLADACTAACMTLGRTVEVTRPGGQLLRGTAVALADDGALLVESGGRVVPVHAGDVMLRTVEDGPAV
ncbi:biotin--[acetyl-CoA-carboxylase] ligase [Actinotalea sp.]|uniref:biotin--[acetyl-CoA-carboxylase] ligase n=1 Tax=Actinotalea sp. TaxID=1872145 RepID=UPI00356B0E5D